MASCVRRGLLWIACVVALAWPGYGQFSPGELSRPHAQLEGLGNCLKCHERGKEISGAKCLDCHGEIKRAVGAKRGYHFAVASQKCVSCHKEHLGRDAQTVIFDKNTFDHSRTGFARVGKHATITCESCHTPRKINDPAILAIIRSTRRQTFLGLSRECAACHDMKHGSKMSDCASCHSPDGWAPVKKFNHAATQFPLRGKHEAVDCRRCHEGLALKGEKLLFTTKPFRECTPCHSSPHSPSFSRQSCATCHTPEGWKERRGGSAFNHDLTAFKLVGKHASVACEECHKPAALAGARSLKLAHSRCVDCHADYHAGEFSPRYGNDCATCHSPFGFVPSTFPIALHERSRFALTGAHAAVPCARCHTRNASGGPRFRFTDFRCEACHKDVHGGQFAAEMKSQSCAACHTTSDWFPRGFDHSRTRFPLRGKHSRLSCKQCHAPQSAAGIVTLQFKGTTMQCSSCHKDAHAGQLAVDGITDCGRCHQPEGWKHLVFDHQTQSRFPLTGAHVRLQCSKCHTQQQTGDVLLTRYKPLPLACESCHAGGRKSYD